MLGPSEVALRTVVALLLAAGCARHEGPPPLSWDFDARPLLGEVRVLPVLADAAPREVSDAAWVAAVPRDHVPLRQERTAQLALIPQAVGLAVPGAVAAALGTRWDGRFRAASWPAGDRSRLRTALAGHTSLEGTLSRIGQDVGGDATLVLWVDELAGAPITAEGPPGELVSTGAGPVLVDAAEPYHVTARVGVALVASDGEVVLRYLDRYEGILSARRDPADVGRQIARDVAAQLLTIWPCDPALLAGEPDLADAD